MYMIWYENRDMYVFVRCKCSVRRMDAGEDSLESRQESCCGRLDDESTISKRVMERRQAAAGELAGMLVCNGDDGCGREAEANWAGRDLLLRECGGRNGCVRAMEQTSS
jgi:hypothetical protein